MSDKTILPDSDTSWAKSGTKKLSDEENKRLEFHINSPLRSANRLIKQLYTDDVFYESATYAWVSENDAKKLFLYGVCKEVIKICIGLMSDKEFLQEMPDDDKPVDPITKIVIGSIMDVQTYRIRKMVELLSLLILFDRKTKHDEEYRIFLSAENMDLALSRQEDFRELYEKRVILNTQHSIDNFSNRIQEDMKRIGVTELWFLDNKKLKDFKPSVFRSKKAIYLDALMAANVDERLALGISYGRGYSRTSQAVHPLIGSHDYGKNDNNIGRVFENFSYLSIISMHIMHLAYKLAWLDDIEGLAKIMGVNFEKSEASKSISALKKEFECGDLALTIWTDLVEIVDKHTSKYGYNAYKVKYLLRAPIPDIWEDWLESQNILKRLMTKSMVREFYEKNIHSDKLPEKLAELWPEIMQLSDEELMRSAKHFFIDLHQAGALLPMLLETGFLKKKNASNF